MWIRGFVGITIFEKQSQFVPGQIGVSSYMKGNYDNKPPCRTRKSKLVLSGVEWIQFKPNWAVGNNTRLGQIALGHTKAKTSQIYAQTLSDKIKTDMNKFHANTYEEIQNPY